MRQGRDNHFEKEELNIRAFYLKLLGKIWILPLALVIGAVLGGVIYYVSNVVYGPARSYSSVSKLYIEFAYDETGTVVDYYNAYTWNDLMSTDDIINTTLSNLEKEGVPVVESYLGGTLSGSISGGVTKQEVIDSTTAEIPSDGRLMVLTIENHDKDLTDAIAKATDLSLESFGLNHDEFISIETRSCESAALVTYTDRTKTALVTGAVLFLIAGILLLFLKFALDDAVYVPEDLEKRYHLPVLGILLKKENSQIESRFKNEMIASFVAVNVSSKPLALISPSGMDSASAVSKIMTILKSAVETSDIKLEAHETPGVTLEAYRDLAGFGGVILVIGSGESRGTLCDHVISQLKRHDCEIKGIVMTDVNDRFIKRYYGI